MVKIFFLSVFGLSQMATVSAHPMHVSIAEAEYNSTTSSLEVALRLTVESMTKLMGTYKPKERESIDNVDQYLARKLANVFYLQFEDASFAEIQWVGKELSHKYVWLYFEFSLPKNTNKFNLSNQINFDSEQDQANTITLKFNEQRFSVVSTKQKPVHKIELN